MFERWLPFDLHHEVHRASHLAHVWHNGQVDKAGHPYISHPAGVVGILVGSERYERLPRKKKIVAKAAAWLHDTIEDCGVSPQQLLREGISAYTVYVVMLLTHTHGEPQAEYLHRVSRSRVATAVKFADMTHNSLPQRLALLDQPTRDRLSVKYANGFVTLEMLENRRANER